MYARDNVRQALDSYYGRIHINDFSSFIKSDFRDNMLFDLSEDRAQKNITESKNMLDQIHQWRKLPYMTYEELVELDIVEDFCRYIIRNNEWYWYKFNITHNTTPLPYVVKRLETYPIETISDLEMYLFLLIQFPEKLREMEAKSRQQEKMGIILPEDQLTICINLLNSLIQPSGSLLQPANRIDVLLDLPSSIKGKIDNAINDFNYSLRQLSLFLKHDYNHAGINVIPGLCNIKNGIDYYNQQIITYTSYSIPPEELHNMGLHELEVTRAKMQKIIKDLGFNMDIPEFEKYLKHNRVCFDSTPEQLQARFERAQSRIERQLKNYFLRIPKSGCRCEALPKSKENSTSWGYYSVPIGTEKQGVFYYSAAELSSRSQIRTAAIVAHELIPGHHFQTSLIAEDSTLPIICREHFNTAFADGWAEYSADLVNEMGAYDLYDLYGRYAWDMVLCCRLVVDSGLNGMGWNIDRAKAFMRDNTILTDSEIFTETLRYSVDMPAQALSYKFGSLKIHQLRDRAESALCNRFDIKKYHNEILRYGSVPLNILDHIVDHFIIENK